MFRQDFIKRQIELLAQALASIMQKRKAGQAEQALTELQQAYGAMNFDPMLLRLDARSLVMLVKDKQKLSALCALLAEEAEVRRALGEQVQAERLEQRVAAIKLAAGISGTIEE